MIIHCQKTKKIIITFKNRFRKAMNKCLPNLKVIPIETDIMRFHIYTLLSFKLYTILHICLLSFLFIPANITITPFNSNITTRIKIK